MKFNSEQEKQTYINNLEQMVAEITKVENHPECSGYTIEKSDQEIAGTCLELEELIRDVENFDDKLKIIGALRKVENFYEEHLKRRINAPFVKFMSISWYDANIEMLNNLLVQDNSNQYAPTAKTCELYCDYVEQYSQLLQKLRDSKTPGHPACIARYQEELHTSIIAGRAMAARSTSPVNMMLPQNPNMPNNNSYLIVQFSPGDDMPFENSENEDSDQSRDGVFFSQ